MHFTVNRFDRGDADSPCPDRLNKRRRHCFRSNVRYFRRPSDGVHGVMKTESPVLVFLSEVSHSTTCSDISSCIRFSPERTYVTVATCDQLSGLWIHSGFGRDRAALIVLGEQ
jgi:hypothetical protein